MLRLLLTALATLTLASAAEVTGKWDFTAQAPNGREYKLELALKQDAGKLTGTMTSTQGTIDLQDVKLEANELTYKVQAGEALVAIKLTVSADSMKGNFTMPDGTTGPVTVTRGGTAAPAGSGNSSVVGKWNATATTPDAREIKTTIDIREKDGKLGGTLTTADGQAVELQDTKYEGGELTFALNTDNGVYKIKMTVSGSTAKGKFTDPGGQTGNVTATK